MMDDARKAAAFHSSLHVITGLVPVIPIEWNAAPHRIGMAGTRPAMTKAGAGRRRVRGRVRSRAG
jgi:hypothetical protein